MVKIVSEGALLFSGDIQCTFRKEKSEAFICLSGLLFIYCKHCLHPLI